MSPRDGSGLLPPPPSPRLDRIEAPDPTRVLELQESLKLPRVMCGVLVGRGLEEPEQAKAVLRPSLESLHPPEELAGLPEAVVRVRKAIEEGETIFVHGDYDVDGMSGTALMTRWLRILGGRVEPFVPNRIRDGYDLGGRGLMVAKEVGASLLITVDCGILAHEPVEAAMSSGLEVIVTDHHTPGPDLPPALAVLNPSRSDCPYPNKGLCGAGVAFKLCQGLAAAFGRPQEELHPFLDLVALATIGDLVPLKGENRTLVRFGLRALNRTTKPGLQALSAISGIGEGGATAGIVGFGLAPRLNAVGRLGEASDALRLLLTESPEEARRLASLAEEMNRERKTLDQRTLQEALSVLAEMFDPEEDFGVVLASERWHPGVVGIVASRVVERIHRPTVLVAMDGDRGKGSARSIPGFHLLSAIEAGRSCLERFGGHRQAAGLEVTREKLPRFREIFNKEAKAVLKGGDLRPSIRVDLEVELPEMNRDLFSFLEYLGPHGIGNPRPVFLARKVGLRGPPRVVGLNHLKTRLSQAETVLDSIGFGLGDRIDPRPWAKKPVDAVFQLQENEYRGSRSLQARLLDLRPSGASP